MREIECDEVGCELEPPSIASSSTNQVGGGAGLIPLEYTYVAPIGKITGAIKRKSSKPKKRVQKGAGRRKKKKVQVGGKKRRRTIKKCSVANKSSRKPQRSRSQQKKYKRRK